MKNIALIFLSVFLWSPGLTQYLPVHPTNGIYQFIIELANEQLLDISTTVKPLGRKELSGLLQEVDASKLSSRQQKELAFYLRDFNKEQYSHKDFDRRLDLFYYRDSIFSFTLNPVGGGNYFLHSGGSAWHWWNGAEAEATAGKWVFYGSLRDNHESEALTRPGYMNQNYGGANFKSVGNGQIDYWEYRGGFSYDFGIGNIGIYKDHFSWGSNYNGAGIFSGRTHSFAHIALNMHPVKWFEFRYVHGWLVSEVIDSSRTFILTNGYGTDSRVVYHSKFLAANFFTFKPLKKLHLSLGNSIVYDYDNPHLVYFIPAMFYKAVDHHLSSGINNMNSQMFFDISARLIPKTHIYTTLFLDELAVKRIFNPDAHNFLSSKTGIRLENIFPNLYGGMEYTITNALTYQHNVPTTSFESNRFNLGHYLTDNARELFLYLGYRPVRAMDVKLSWEKAEKGPDHTLLGTMPRAQIKPFTPVVWESERLSLQLSWQVINGAYFRFGYSLSNIRGEEEYLERYTPEFWRGKHHGMNLGVNFGF